MELVLTPAGHLRFVASGAGPGPGPGHGPDPDPGWLAVIAGAFERGSGYGLFELGAGEPGRGAGPEAGFWREFGAQFVGRLCAVPDLESRRGDLEVPCPAEELLGRVLSAPPMRGGEYLTPAVLERFWGELTAACQDLLAGYEGTVSDFLHERSPVWNLLGRVHFHLAEQKRQPDTPFAFMATYTTRVGAQARLQHLPLGQALREYAGAGNRTVLLSLLEPVSKATASSAFLKDLVDSGAVFHPLSWSPAEAYRFLQEIPVFESAGIIVKVPDWWRSGSSRRPQVQVSVGGRAPAGVGLDALLSFSVEVVLDGERLDESELQALLESHHGLVLLKGRWVEVDRERLAEVMAHWKSMEAQAPDGVSFLEAMRLLAGGRRDLAGDGEEGEAAESWSVRVAGPWLDQVLRELEDPTRLDPPDLDGDFRARLRPYQKVGFAWLWTLYRLGLGGCLADDMGLGKTVQVLALLVAVGRTRGRGPHLLVVPASLIGNWIHEIGRFAPGLQSRVAHPSARSEAIPGGKERPDLDGTDLVLTSYGYLSRMPWAREVAWDIVIADEAQAVKNPGTTTARALKALPARLRLALTGTPVENRLGDLWSLFDFINPGLLGTVKAFGRFSKGLEERSRNRYEPLRRLIRPYILRRLKTDPAVIDDLPDKTEVLAHCPLTREQAALYQESVEQLAREVEDVEGIARRGLILAYLTRFKQILNHPSQWLGDGRWEPERSGKFQKLAALAEELAARQEKVLVFTQYREVIDPLAGFLGRVFGRAGLTLHGQTPVGKRAGIVERFQQDEDVPFMILSLKAGGTGLNLTAASHVIHFDRWWNPAVEQQATDRAFRIGQKRNVMVHLFLCNGTLEEKIQEILDDKRKLSRELLETGAEAVFTEMGRDELLKLVSLDLDSVLDET